jgi:hypothetical protein
MRHIFIFCCFILAACDTGTDQKKQESNNQPASNSISLIRSDMEKLHEAIPSGVKPDAGWYEGPRIGYGNEPPADWSAMITWGQVYAPQSGNPAENTRFQILNMQAWYLSKSDGSWKKWQSGSTIGGANYAEDFQDDVNIEADIRDESGNGGGISSTLQPGYNFHFWTENERTTIEPGDIGGVWVTMEGRLIMDDPNGTDDRLRARLMLCAGADYWLCESSEWDQWTTNGDVGVGRFRYLSADWQFFNMHTLTDEQIITNPPPF